MKLTFVQPAIGKVPNQNYIKTWQMEPLPIATIAGLTNRKVFDIEFFDDRMEEIGYQVSADALIIPIETYTAKRSYQIIQEFRKNNPKIKVIAGGFHATLIPEEVACYADAIVIGQAENIWEEVCDDLLNNTLKSRYEANSAVNKIVVDRSVFSGKRYLPVGLIETGRGCKFPCEFCSIQTFFDRTVSNRNIEEVMKNISELKKEKNIFFFVDDNFVGNIKHTKELLKALIPLKIRAITQLSINACHDEELLELMHRAGLRGVLIGFESMEPKNLIMMNKRFNSMKGGYEVALNNLKKYKIGVYGTFVFGYDYDNRESFQKAYDLALNNNFYLAAFNHLTPFPGTPLYKRLQDENRLIFEKWWLDDHYRYGVIPFKTNGLSADEIEDLCVENRLKFYNWKSILKRSVHNYSDNFMFRNFFGINFMHGTEVLKRNQLKLGDVRMGLERRDVFI